MLLECVEAIRSDLDLRGFAQHVVETIAASLGSAPVACYLLSDTSFEPVACAACALTDLDPIAGSAPLSQRASQAEFSFEIGPDVLEPIFGRIPYEVSPLFRRAQSAFVIPLASGRRPAGFIAAGVANGTTLSDGVVRELDAIGLVLGLVADLDQATRATQFGNAQRIQDNALRRDLPKVPGLDYAIRYKPAVVISGDFYDVQSLTPSRAALTIGDIAGKGIPAALLMANVLDRIRETIRTKGNDLAQLTDALHRMMFERSPEGSYATLFYAVIDLDYMSLRYASAGHQPQSIVIERASATPRVQTLTEGGAPLGLFPTPPVPHTFGGVNLFPGDWLIAVTDGVTDATNDAGDMWGQDAYHAAALQAAAESDSAEALSAHLFSSMMRFANGGRQHDDVTILVAGVPPTRLH